MAVKKPAPLSDALDAIARAAPGLRAAGVLEIAVDGVSAKLAPAEPPTPKEAKPPEREATLGDLDDFRRDDAP